MHVGDSATDEFAKWMKRLKDTNARARINARIRRISLTGNFGDAKPVGDGIYELRIGYGPGYRVYYSQRKARSSCCSSAGTSPRNRRTSTRPRSSMRNTKDRGRS